MQSQTEVQVGVNAGVNYGTGTKLGAGVAQARLT